MSDFFVSSSAAFKVDNISDDLVPNTLNRVSNIERIIGTSPPEKEPKFYSHFNNGLVGAIYFNTIFFV